MESHKSPDLPFSHPELDALRFFAFFLVFYRHMEPISALPPMFVNMGAFGVQIFFLLSAYLIISLLVRERQKTGTIAVRAFFVRRILRIWPLYFTALLAAYALGRLVDVYRITGNMIAAFMLLGGNLYTARIGWLATPVSILWSISIEEQFYLLVPMFVKLSGTRAIKLLSWLSILTAYIALAYLGHHNVNPHLGVFTNSFVEFQFFGAGGVIALATSGRRLLLHPAVRIVMMGAGLGLLYAAGAVYGLQSDMISTGSGLVKGYGVLLAGCVLIFLSVLDSCSRSVPVLSYLGKISYGLYVYHKWVLSLAFSAAVATMTRGMIPPVLGDGIALLITIGTASLSYRFFERKALLLKSRFEVVPSRSV